MRRVGHLVRSNSRLDAATKTLLGIQPRAAKAKVLPCPPEPPRLWFVRALHERGATPVHELAFTDHSFSSKRPAGAVRLELFVDLIPPDAPVPAQPGAGHASRAWYLRSYTRSPIKLIPPIARVPMRVVYWGRWADTMGEVGPMSAPAAGWVEGGPHGCLPGSVGLNLPGRTPFPILEVDEATPAAALPDEREESYRVAVLELRYGTMGGRDVAGELPAPVARRPSRQLEGPAVEAAA